MEKEPDVIHLSVYFPSTVIVTYVKKTTRLETIRNKIATYYLLSLFPLLKWKKSFAIMQVTPTTNDSDDTDNCECLPEASDLIH